MNKYALSWKQLHKAPETKKNWIVPALSLGLYMFVVIQSLIIFTNK